jgi:hypothetical protein
MGDVGKAVGGFYGASVGGVAGLPGMFAGADFGSGGGLGFSDPDKTENRQYSGYNLAPESDFEKQLRGNIDSQYKGMEGLVNQGPGMFDVQDSRNSSQALATMLQQYSQNGGRPMQSDLSEANSYAQQVMQPQMVAAQEQYRQQGQGALALADQLGRPGSDPILQNKMSQYQGHSTAMMQAQQGAIGAQYAQQLPGQRIGYMQDANAIKGQLAMQAMSNRQALLGLGSQLQNQEREWRKTTANKWSTQTGESGGGPLAALGMGAAMTGTVFKGLSAFGGG